MASGGQQNPMKGIRQNSEPINNGNGFGDAQWTLLPNNLELNTRSRPTKKQRNRDKTRAAIPAENLSSTPATTQNTSSNSLSLQDFSRGKFTTATWLKDQLGTGGASKKNTSIASDETFSDAEHPIVNRRNINIPVNHRPQTARFLDIQGTISRRRSAMENENTKTFKEECTKKQPDTAIIFERLTHLKDCIVQVTAILQQLEQSDDPSAKDEISNLENMKKKLTDEQREHKALLQQLQAYEDSNRIVNGVSPYPPAAKIPALTKGSLGHRDINGGPSYLNDEDMANKQNHLLEKMKVSQEKLTALKEQQSLLLSMQKKAEDKLAAFQAQLVKNSPDASQTDQDWHYTTERGALQSASDECAMNGETGWENELYTDSQPHWQPGGTQKPVKSVQGIFHATGWKEEPQDLAQLHINLEHIKKRVEILQQISDNRNQVEPTSPSPAEFEQDGDVGQRVAAVEWQRKKLKNKLVELQERKKANDELIKELSLLKEATNTAGSVNDEDTNFTVTNTRDTQKHHHSNDDKERKLEDLRETLSQLRGMINSRPVEPSGNAQDIASDNQEAEVTSMNFVVPSSQRDASVPPPSRRVALAKRDNIRKEQNAGFPARRHYEAEGRANEDPDVPAATALATSPSPDQNAWDSDPRVQEKIRELQNTKQKLQVMQELMSSIQDARQSGQQVPIEYLQLLTSFEEAEGADDFQEDETATDNEDEQENDDSSSIVEGKTSDVTVTGNKEHNSDPSQQRLVEIVRLEQAEGVNSGESQDLEHLIRERERLMKLHEKFVQMQLKFPSPRQNNEPVRSSGEGGNLQKRKPRCTHTLPSFGEHLQTRRLRQDNLLTRQNLETMESQNRNDSSSNIPTRDNVSAKNDNINNLSAKLSKHIIHCTPRSSDSITKYNTDTASSFSTTDLNQSISLRDEIQHKTVLEDILNRDRSKRQNYSRNQDNQIHSNSSVNSEPLDGSSSALAPDTTVAATWGGSSTQENFEDENEEPIESLEEQEEEEGSNNEGIPETIQEDERVVAPVLNQYPNEPPCTDYSANTSVKRRDNRLQKYFKSTQLNQWPLRKNFSRAGASSKRLQPTLHPAHSENLLLEEPAVQQEEPPRASASNTDATNNSAMPTKFVQQLQQQLEQLNALCQPLLHDQQSVLPGANRGAAATFPYPVPNSCRPSQPASDVMHHYTQQLQLQQQLLLSLSQCCHTLYMQQLEIQHLQRCLQQNPDSEAAIHPMNPQGPTSDDFTLRPWFLAPWLNTAVPSMPFPPSQVSPMSAPPFLPPTQPPAFAFSPNAVPPTAPPPCALVTGMQPARAVVHPSGQDTRPSTETLNNQVPPRTRANNFWDNFRSYSRQNLLSTSNSTKSKETSGLPGAPQIRQVHPIFPNDNSWGHRSRVFIPPHTESSAPATHTSERSFARPIANPELQELLNKPKKPNSSKQQGLNSSRIVHDIPRRPSHNLTTPLDQSSRSNPVHAQNIEAACIQLRPVATNVNISHPCPPQTASKSGVFPSVVSASSQPQQEAIYSEVSKLLSQNDSQSTFLMELLQEIQNLGSDTHRQRALNAIREMVNIDATDHISNSAEDKNKNETQAQPNKYREKPEQLVENNPDGASAFSSAINSDLPSGSGTNETAGQWNNQSWPPATIIPLGKHHSTKTSTGAVKKKVISKTVPTCAPTWDCMPTTDSQNMNDQMAQSAASPKTELYDNLVERVILDVLPYIHSHIMEDCSSVRMNLSAKILDALQSHSSTTLPNKCLALLHQALMRLMAKYSGLKWCECEPDLLKGIAEVLFKELSLFNLISQRPSGEESREYSTTAPGINPQPDVLPPSCKPTVDNKKQMTPCTDNRDEAAAINANNCFGSSVLQESEEQIGELYINMPVEENASLPMQFNGIPQPDPSRGAIGGANNYSSYSTNWPVQTGTAEEDMGYECDPEAELEPEVEAGTEADLAEADQSPGQQGATTGADAWHVDSVLAVPLGRGAAAHIDENLVSEDGAMGDSPLDLVLAGQVPIDANANEEITLDDIPTKLMPLSEEELQKQINEEQEANSLLAEVVEEVPLSGEGDAPKEPTLFL